MKRRKKLSTLRANFKHSPSVRQSVSPSVRQSVSPSVRQSVSPSAQFCFDTRQNNSFRQFCEQSMADIEMLKKELEMSDEARNYAESIIEAVQLSLVVLDQELHVKSANRSFYEHFHLTRREVGADFLEALAIRNSDASKLRGLFRETLTAHTEFKQVEVIHSFPNIGCRTILFSGRAIHWEGEESEAILVSLEDITEQRHAEIKLEVESANARLGEAVVSAANEARTLNEALQIFIDRICAHTGWPVGHVFLLSDISKGEFVSSKVWHFDDPTKFEKFRKETEETKFTVDMGFSGHIVSTGKPDWILDFSKDPILSRRILAEDMNLKIAIAFPVPANQDILAVLEFFSSNPKEPDQKLLEIMGNISSQLGRVIERMHERDELLLKEQRARAEAENANQAKDLFLAILSHELRTPLTTILSWAQMLRMRRLDAEKSKRGIEIIEQSAQAQSQLINDLLDVSGIIMGKLQLDLQPVDPAQVVLASIDLVRPMANQKSIQIETKIEPSVGVILADPVRLQQVVLNLLTNAIKFSYEGKWIIVHLERIKEDGGREYAMIKVSDEGKGISPAFLPQIFNRFSQADSSSTRIYGGLGLGLALVRNLVMLQGGVVEAESPGEGKGATFTVKIPTLLNRKGLTQNSRSESEIKALERDEEQIRLDGLRVLLVDDEANTREALTVMLHSFGAKVRAAASAREALKVFSRFKPQVLVSDIAMPDEDGYSLIRKIRALGPNGRKIPSLALTAYAAAEDVKRALDAGFQSHLSKPVDAKKLTGAIARLAGGK